MRKQTFLLLAFFVLVAFSSSAAPRKELVRLNGVVDFRGQAEARWSSLFSIKPVNDTDWTRTHEASLAKLDFNDGNQSALIYERTLVQIDKVEPDKTSLRQLIGRLKLAVKHHLFGKEP